MPSLLLPETVLPLSGVDQGLVVTLQLVVVPPQSINLTLTLVVGGEEALQSVSQLGVETVPGIEGGGKVILHYVCLVCNQINELTTCFGITKSLSLVSSKATSGSLMTDLGSEGMKDCPVWSVTRL